MSHLTEDLIELIKLRSMIPSSSSTFDNSKFLLLANSVLQQRLVSDLSKVKEDFFLTSEDVSIEANISNYGIPARAIANALKTVFYKDESGNLLKLERVDVDQAGGGSGLRYYILGDEIVLLPTPTASLGQIRFIFPAKPSDLILTTSCGKITAVASNVFTIDTDLSGDLAVGGYVDFLCNQSPFKLWKYRSAITAISATQITVALADVIDANSNVLPQVGDYICPSGSANIPQIPVSHHPLLAQMTAVVLLESFGDINKLQNAKATLAEMRGENGTLVKNRVENSPKKAAGNGLKRFFR